MGFFTLEITAKLPITLTCGTKPYFVFRTLVTFFLYYDNLQVNIHVEKETKRASTPELKVVVADSAHVVIKGILIDCFVLEFDKR